MADETQRAFETFEHQADIGVRGRGATQAEAFANAALALTSVITDLGNVVDERQVDVTCEAPDVELLLVDWLNAVVYEMATRRMLFSRFAVELNPGALTGHMWGEGVNQRKHAPAVEVKGATYTGLSVHQDDAGLWVAECIVDV